MRCEVKKDCPKPRPAPKRIRRGPWFALGVVVGVIVAGAAVGAGVYLGVTR